MAVGLKAVDCEFDVLAEYSGCWLCGAVFQSAQDRAYYTLLEQGISSDQLINLKAHADRLRFEWRDEHTLKHSSEEHEQLARSKDLLTPKAAMRLAPLGIFPLEGSADVMQALAEAPRAPLQEIEGVIN